MSPAREAAFIYAHAAADHTLVRAEPAEDEAPLALAAHPVEGLGANCLTELVVRRPVEARSRQNTPRHRDDIASALDLPSEGLEDAVEIPAVDGVETSVGQGSSRSEGSPLQRRREWLRRPPGARGAPSGPGRPPAHPNRSDARILSSLDQTVLDAGSTISRRRRARWESWAA